MRRFLFVFFAFLLTATSILAPAPDWLAKVGIVGAGGELGGLQTAEASGDILPVTIGKAETPPIAFSENDTHVIVNNWQFMFAYAKEGGIDQIYTPFGELLTDSSSYQFQVDDLKYDLSGPLEYREINAYEYEVIRTCKIEDYGTVDLIWNIRAEDRNKLTIDFKNGPKAINVAFNWLSDISSNEYIETDSRITFVKDGTELAFDWSDAAKFDTSSAVSVKSEQVKGSEITFNLGTVKPNQRVVIDPSTVGTSTSSYAVSFPNQRVVYSASRFWLIYSDGTGLVAQSSADGITWSSTEDIISGSPFSRSVSVWFDGTNICLAYVEDGSTALRNDYYITGDVIGTTFYGVNWRTQSFTPAFDYTLTKVKLKLYRSGSPGNVTVSIRATDGTGKPTGADLVSENTDGNTLATGSPYTWREISFGAGTAVTAGTKYAIVVRALSGSIMNSVGWRYNGSSPTYVGGSYGSSSNSGSTWSMATYNDFMFETWGVGENLIYREYTPNDDGTLTPLAGHDHWEVAIAQAASSSFSRPFVCKDSSGYPVIAYVFDNGTTKTPYVTKSNQNDGTWTSCNFTTRLSTDNSSLWALNVLPLDSQDLVAIYARDGEPINSTVYDFSSNSWSAEATTAEAIESGSSFSAVIDYVNDASYPLHVVFQDADLHYLRYVQGDGLVWRDEETIDSDGVAGIAPVLSRTTGGALVCFWAGNPDDDHIYYRPQILKSWGVTVDWLTESNITSNVSISCAYEMTTTNYIPVCWLTSDSSPYNVRFAALERTLSSNRFQTLSTILDETSVDNYQLPVSVYRNNPSAVNQAVSLVSTDINNGAFLRTSLATFPVGQKAFTMEGWFSFSGFYEDANIAEDFEWGAAATWDGVAVDDTTHTHSLTHNINWSKTAAGTSKAEIDDDTTAHGGSLSLRLYRDGTNAPYAAAPLTTQDTAYEISWEWKKELTANSAVYHGNTAKNHLIYMYHGTDNKLWYFDHLNNPTAIGSPQVTLAVNTWGKVTLKDINFTAGTYDIYVDDVLKTNNAEMRDANFVNNQIWLYQSAGTAQSWFDDVSINYLSGYSKPTDETWRSLVNIKDDSATTFWNLGVDMSSGDYKFSCDYNTGSWETIESTSTVDPETFYHLALSYDNTDGATGKMRFYVDGTLQGSAKALAADPDLALPVSLRVGVKHTGGNNWSMKAQEIRVSDIAQYTTASFSAPDTAFSVDTNTLALYHMDSGYWSVYPVIANDGDYNGVGHVFTELPDGNLIDYYYSSTTGSLPSSDGAQTNYQYSTDNGATWTTAVVMYDPPSATIGGPEAAGGGVTPDGSVFFGQFECLGNYVVTPGSLNYFYSPSTGGADIGYKPGFRKVAGCYTYNANTATYTNNTAAINDGVGPVDAWSSHEGAPADAVGDQLYIGGDIPFTNAEFNIGTKWVFVGATVTKEYWNGASWATLKGQIANAVVDETTGFTSGTGSKWMAWAQPKDWAKTTSAGNLGATARYWVRFTLTALTTYTTHGHITQAWLGPSTLLPYNWVEDFAGTYRGKAWTTGGAQVAKLTVASQATDGDAVGAPRDIGSTITCAALDSDELAWVYYDLGYAFVNRVDILFNIRMNTSDDGAIFGVGFTNATAGDDITGWGADDIHVTMRRVGADYKMYLGRGNDVAEDHDTGAVATTYYCRLLRVSNAQEVRCYVYPTEADRLAGTNDVFGYLTINLSASYATVKYRYCYGSVNKTAGGGDEANGVVSDMSWRLFGYTTSYPLEVPGRGLLQPCDFAWQSVSDSVLNYFRIAYFLTADDGASFTGPWIIAEDGEKVLVEPTITYAGTNRVLCFTRTQGSLTGSGHFYQTYSDDGGVTWNALEDTLWNAVSVDDGYNGSQVHIECHEELVAVITTNRQSNRLEVKSGDISSVLNDPTRWNTLDEYCIIDLDPISWITVPGTPCALLPEGNLAPRYSIVFGLYGGALPTGFENLYCAVPTAVPWNGDSWNARYIKDDTGKGQDLEWWQTASGTGNTASGGLNQRWATGAFSSTRTAGWDNDRFVAYSNGYTRDNFTDVRFTDLEGNSLYYHLVGQSDRLRASFVCKAKVGSSVLTDNATISADHVHVTTGALFSAGEFVNQVDSGDTLGETLEIDHVTDNVVYFTTNLTKAYSTDDTARLCFGVRVVYGDWSLMSHDAVYHDPSETNVFYEGAESGAVGDQWNETDAADGDMVFSTAEQRRSSHSLKFTQTSAADDYEIYSDNWGALSNAVVEFWTLHMVATDNKAQVMLIESDNVSHAVTNHYHGIGTSQSYEYLNEAAALTDTLPTGIGTDYIRARWQYHRLECIQSTEGVVWKLDGKLIASDSHRGSGAHSPLSWTGIAEMEWLFDNAYNNANIYLDDIVVRKLSSSLDGYVGTAGTLTMDISVSPSTWTEFYQEGGSVHTHNLRMNSWYTSDNDSNQDYFALTNNGGSPVDILISSSDNWTGTGVTWHVSPTGTPGDHTIGLWAGITPVGHIAAPSGSFIVGFSTQSRFYIGTTGEGTTFIGFGATGFQSYSSGEYDILIKPDDPANFLVENLAASATQDFGLLIWTCTSNGGNAVMTGTVTLTATVHT